MPVGETPMTREYWSKIGGTLVEEYPVVRRTSAQSPRKIDGLILPERPNEVIEERQAGHLPKAFFHGREVVVVQTKKKRLGRYLMGQATFSPMLVEKFLKPAAVRPVALCSTADPLLAGLLEEQGVAVHELPHHQGGRESKNRSPALLEAYWRKVGGQLVRNFPVTEGGTDEDHTAEAIIIRPGSKRVELTPHDAQVDAEDVVLVHTCARFKDGRSAWRHGMWVAGDALYSLRLFKQLFRPRSVTSVALAPLADAVITPLIDGRPGLRAEVVTA